MIVRVEVLLWRSSGVPTGATSGQTNFNALLGREEKLEANGSLILVRLHRKKGYPWDEVVVRRPVSERVDMFSDHGPVC